MEEQQALQIFSALAQESRLRIFRHMVQSGTEELPAGLLAEHLRIAPATLSFHLKELTAAGLVNRRREGRNVLYSLNTGRMKAFLAYLMRDCCGGRPELCEPFVELSWIGDSLKKPAV